MHNGRQMALAFGVVHCAFGIVHYTSVRTPVLSPK
jgi:hypothetical protein